MQIYEQKTPPDPLLIRISDHNRICASAINDAHETGLANGLAIGVCLGVVFAALFLWVTR